MTAAEFFQRCIDRGFDGEQFAQKYFGHMDLFPETFDPEQQGAKKARRSAQSTSGKGKRSARRAPAPQAELPGTEAKPEKS